jgi:hypothetical protein
MKTKRFNRIISYFLSPKGIAVRRRDAIVLFTIFLMSMLSVTNITNSSHALGTPHQVERSMPSTISQDGSNFIAQGTLTSVTAKQTNNIVNTLAYYDVLFTTATSEAIKTINVLFPAGTEIGTTNLLVEKEGIGDGTAAKTGTNRITYTVDNAVSVPAGTEIRLVFTPLSNPSAPAPNYQVTVTTRDSIGNVIDGPTNSLAYNIKQINTNDIGDNAITTPKIADEAITSTNIADNAITTPKIADEAITSTKPAESFMKSQWSDFILPNN